MAFCSASSAFAEPQCPFSNLISSLPRIKGCARCKACGRGHPSAQAPASRLRTHIADGDAEGRMSGADFVCAPPKADVDHDWIAKWMRNQSLSDQRPEIPKSLFDARSSEGDMLMLRRLGLCWVPALHGHYLRRVLSPRGADAAGGTSTPPSPRIGITVSAASTPDLNRYPAAPAPINGARI